MTGTSYVGLSVSFTSNKYIRTAIAAVILLAMVGGTLAFVAARKNITLDVDGQTRTVTTFASSVEGLLAEEGIEVGDQDEVSPALDASLDSVNTVTVRYAKQIQILADGETETVWTNAADAPEALSLLQARGDTVELVASRSLNSTRAEIPLSLSLDSAVRILVDGRTVQVPAGHHVLGDMLTAHGIELGQNDRVRIRYQDTTADGTVTVVVQRVTIKFEVVTESVAFAKETVQDSKQYTSYKKVTTAGVNGQRTLTQEVVLVDGEEESRTTVNTTVDKQPVTEVTTVGTKKKPTFTVPNTPTIPAGEAQEIAYQHVKARGWGEGEFTCLVNLWKRESGWNYKAHNKRSGAYGIPQALPGSKMASAGADWKTNPETQIKWGLKYISGRYKTPCGAWQHFLNKGWY